MRCCDNELCEWGGDEITSLMLTSASTYCRPFCMMEMRAAGGTRAPLMLDWLMWLSIPKVNAEWEKPGNEHTENTVSTMTTPETLQHKPLTPLQTYLHFLCQCYAIKKIQVNADSGASQLSVPSILFQCNTFWNARAIMCFTNDGLQRKPQQKSNKIQRLGTQ